MECHKVLHTAHLSSIHHSTLADAAWSLSLPEEISNQLGFPNLPQSTLAVFSAVFPPLKSSMSYPPPHKDKNPWIQGGPLLVTNGHKTPRNDLEFSLGSFHPYKWSHFTLLTTVSLSPS